MPEVIVGSDGETEGAAVGAGLAAAALSGEAAAEGRHAQIEAQQASAKADAAAAEAQSAAQLAGSAHAQAAQAESSVDDKIAAAITGFGAQLMAALKPAAAPEPAAVNTTVETRPPPPQDTQPKSVRKKGGFRKWYETH